MTGKWHKANLEDIVNILNKNEVNYQEWFNNDNREIRVCVDELDNETKEELFFKTNLIPDELEKFDYLIFWF